MITYLLMFSNRLILLIEIRDISGCGKCQGSGEIEGSVRQVTAREGTLREGWIEGVEQVGINWRGISQTGIS